MSIRQSIHCHYYHHHHRHRHHHRHNGHGHVIVDTIHVVIIGQSRLGIMPIRHTYANTVITITTTRASHVNTVIATQLVSMLDYQSPPPSRVDVITVNNTNNTGRFGTQQYHRQVGQSIIPPPGNSQSINTSQITRVKSCRGASTGMACVGSGGGGGTTINTYRHHGSRVGGVSGKGSQSPGNRGHRNRINTTTVGNQQIIACLNNNTLPNFTAHQSNNNQLPPSSPTIPIITGLSITTNHQQQSPVYRNR